MGTLRALLLAVLSSAPTLAAEAPRVLWQTTLKERIGHAWTGGLVRFGVPEADPARHRLVLVAEDQAREILIQRQDTHLDSLAERLREPRVRRVIEPILMGSVAGEDLPEDDIRYVVDLGLVRWNGGLEIANPIYAEIVPRALSTTTRAYLPRLEPLWLRADGRLDIDRLLDAFLAFWRQHGEPLMRTVAYPEVAPHLVMMAFLDRVRNAGGTLEREYAVGSGRMDLCLRYGPDTFAFELKVWREGRPDPLTEGLAQLDGYLGGLGLTTGWLVIFDRRATAVPVEERTSAAEATTPAGRRVTVVRG